MSKFPKVDMILNLIKNDGRMPDRRGLDDLLKQCTPAEGKSLLEELGKLKLSRESDAERLRREGAALAREIQP